MSNFTKLLPDTPSGVDPEVLSMINALFQEPEVTMQQEALKAKKTEAWWKTAGAPSADQQVSEKVVDEEQNKDVYLNTIGEDEFEFNMEDFLLPPSEDDIEANVQFSKVNSLLHPEPTPTPQPNAQLVDPRSPKIIARYTYPSERQLGTPPPLPPRTVPIAPPTLASLIVMLYQFISEFFTDLLCDSEPAIIEYSTEEIRRQANEVRIEAQAAEFNVPASIDLEIAVPEKFVVVVALLHIGSNDERRAILVMAKPKRVRQLMRIIVILLRTCTGTRSRRH
jgi:hypothetical protein